MVADGAASEAKGAGATAGAGVGAAEATGGDAAGRAGAATGFFFFAERARGDAAADARPLHRRRGHAHGRGAGGIAARRRQVAAVARGIELRHRASAVPASDRRAAAGAARPRASGRPAFAAHVRGRDRPRAHRAPFDIRAEPNTPPSGKPRRRSANAASISTPRATRCRRP